MRHIGNVVGTPKSLKKLPFLPSLSQNENLQVLEQDLDRYPSECSCAKREVWRFCCGAISPNSRVGRVSFHDKKVGYQLGCDDAAAGGKLLQCWMCVLESRIVAVLSIAL